MPFEVERSTRIDAPPERVHALIDDFHEWQAWSPWEALDPKLQRRHSGPPSGEGARYAWMGNRKAGQGAMEITSSQPDEIGVRLEFLKPWKATNQVTFTLTPVGSRNGAKATDVQWRMVGESTVLTKAFSRLFGMEKMIGTDFERGLAKLKRLAERGSG